MVNSYSDLGGSVGIICTYAAKVSDDDRLDISVRQRRGWVRNAAPARSVDFDAGDDVYESVFASTASRFCRLISAGSGSGGVCGQGFFNAS